MDEKSLSDKIRELLPEDLRATDIYDQLEIRVALSSLIEAVKETSPELSSKYKEIFSARSEDVLSSVKGMDFDALRNKVREGESVSFD